MTIFKSNGNIKAGDELIASSSIYEYDIRKANISVLYDAGVLDKNIYQYLFNADRMERQIYIGNLQKKNPQITKVLQDGIKNARNIFMKENNISEDNIIRVSNDALYTTGVQIHYTKISPHVEFVLKNSFTSYMKIGSFEYFYAYDVIKDIEHYKILGINNIKPHENYFIQLILSIFNTIETTGLEAGANAVMDIIDNYENLLFPVEYYREFDSVGQYRMIGYLLNDIDDTDKSYLNIEYNLDILYRIRNIIFKQLI